MSRETGNQLLSQAEALDDYLGHLLTPNEPSLEPKKSESPSEPVVHQLDQYRKHEDIPVIKPVPVPDRTQLTTEAKPEISKTQQEISVAAEELVASSTTSEASLVAEQESIPAVTEKPSEGFPSIEGLPQWAGETFSCTQIMVDGIPLAFPTDAIREVLDFPAELRPVKSQPEWVRGLMMKADGFIAVIDSAHLFYQQATAQGDVHGYQKILTFGDGRWGLACDDIGDVFSMSANEVRWRSDTSRRPWLAGMLRHCALIDPDKLFEGL